MPDYRNEPVDPAQVGQSGLTSSDFAAVPPVPPLVHEQQAAYADYLAHRQAEQQANPMMYYPVAAPVKVPPPWAAWVYAVGSLLGAIGVFLKWGYLNTPFGSVYINGIDTDDGKFLLVGALLGVAAGAGAALLRINGRWFGILLFASAVVSLFAVFIEMGDVAGRSFEDQAVHVGAGLYVMLLGAATAIVGSVFHAFVRKPAL